MLVARKQMLHKHFLCFSECHHENRLHGFILGIGAAGFALLEVRREKLNLDEAGANMPWEYRKQ